MSSNSRRSQVARLQAQMSQMAGRQMGNPFQVDSDDGGDDEDGQEMALAQQAEGNT